MPDVYQKDALVVQYNLIQYAFLVITIIFFLSLFEANFKCISPFKSQNDRGNNKNVHKYNYNRGMSKVLPLLHKFLKYSKLWSVLSDI